MTVTGSAKESYVQLTTATAWAGVPVAPASLGGAATAPQLPGVPAAVMMPETVAQSVGGAATVIPDGVVGVGVETGGVGATGGVTESVTPPSDTSTIPIASAEAG